MASRSIEPVLRHGGPVHPSLRLPLILLDEQQGYFTDSRNETTASAKSKSGCTIWVSFWMADPPGMSFFSVHCTGSKSRSADFKILPHVVGAEGPSVLFRARFFSRYGEDEYFMYRVGDGELAPSLEWIPLPDGSDSSLHMVMDFGIVPRCARGQYLMAALCDAKDAPSYYQLQIYSSEKRTWSTRTLINPCPGIDTIRPEKVIRLEEGVLGWVDFYQGLLVCDLRQDPPVVYFIPLPKPLPENREKLNTISYEEPSPRLFRDVTCVNGVLRFIEMTHFQVTENPSESSDQDCLYDVDLIRSLKRKHMEEKPKVRYGWRAVTWSRMVGSNCWRKGRFVDDADILVDESAYSSLLSGLRGKSSGKLAFKDLYSVFPTLSTNSDDVLYLKSMVEPSDEHGLVVAVDLGNMALKSVGAHFFEDHDPNRQAFRPCTLSCHLNITPGITVSACHKVTQADSSANNPNSTSTCCVSEPVTGEPRCKIPREVS